MPFRDVWREIERAHAADWKIRLRPAANIVGFNLFPVGWRWTEFVPLTPEDSTVYEVAALESAGCGMPLPNLHTGPTGEIITAGQSFRRRKANEYLAKVLGRSEVKAYHGRQKNIAAPAYGSRLPDRPPMAADYERLSIEHSTIGAMVSRQFETWVDAPQLISHLLGLVETRGAPPKHDRLRTERWCRNVLEGGLLARGENAGTDLTRLCLDWLAATSADADSFAGESLVRPIVSELLREYALDE